MVLFFGIVDFGRVMADGIILEAAARNAAEAAAQEYIHLFRTRPGGVLTAADYDRLHDLAVTVVCEEGDELTRRVMSGSACSMPLTAVCIHDTDGTTAGDPSCGAEATGAPTECDRLSAPAWNPVIEQPPNGALPLLPYVEVRLCYRFLTIWNLTDLQLPLAQGLSLGEIWLQRDRTFVVGNY